MSNCSARCSLALKPRFFIAFIFFAFSVSVAYGQVRKSPPANDAGKNSAGKSSAEVARGKYLVESVAMCGECHTPRNSNGGVDRSRWLQGASVRWVPAEAGPNWPLIAPRIGGTPPANDADMIKLLTTGIWTTGKPLRFPMMPFRMTEGDAKAVVAYLRALTPQN